MPDHPEIPIPSTQHEIGKLLHDLRNPLTPLVTAIEILRSYSPDNRQERILNLMSAQIDEMVALLDQLEGRKAAPAQLPDRVKMESASHRQPEAVLRPRSVLVVDDNPNILAALQLMFEDRGYLVRAATRAEDAVTLAAQFKPDLCLCDISLPTLDGFAAAAMLLAAHPEMQMFSMSGLDDYQDREQSKTAGFIFHFRKPVVFDEMIHAMEGAHSGAL